MLGTHDIPLIGPFWIFPSQLYSVSFYTGIKTEIGAFFFFFESLRMVAHEGNPSTLEAKAEAERRNCCMFRAVLGYAVTSRSTDTAVGDFFFNFPQWKRCILNTGRVPPLHANPSMGHAYQFSTVSFCLWQNTQFLPALSEVPC